MTEETGSNEKIYSYDYKTAEAGQKSAPETVDAYEALGWEIVSESRGLTGSVALNFRRNRKVKSKDQLNRLQMRLDDSLNNIKIMEKKKTGTASAIAIFMGIIGTLVFGGGMSIFLTELNHQLWHYIAGGILGALGIGLCLLAYYSYLKIRDKKTKEMNVQIEKKRDEIAVICEDAQRLLT